MIFLENFAKGKVRAKTVLMVNIHSPTIRSMIEMENVPTPIGILKIDQARLKKNNKKTKICDR